MTWALHSTAFSLGAGALRQPRGMVRGGRREEGSGWGTHVYLWWIHVDIWQNQYNIVKLKKKTKEKSKLVKSNNPPAPTLYSTPVLLNFAWKENRPDWWYHCKSMAIQMLVHFRAHTWVSFSFSFTLSPCVISSILRVFFKCSFYTENLSLAQIFTLSTYASNYLYISCFIHISKLTC